MFAASSLFRRVLLAVVIAGALLGASRPAAAQGTWTKAPNNPNNGGGAFGLWLLTDGRVLSHGGALNQWMVLTPDKTGSYTKGTWKNVASSTHARSGATQHILKDGRFFQAGGEYIDGPQCTASGCVSTEIYDPVANTWTDQASAPYDIGDTGSANLPDGRLIYSTRAGNMIQIYDPATNTWTKNGTMPLGTGDENAWATLQNGGILAVGYHNGGAAIYNPASNTWKKTTVPSGFDTGDTGGITQMFDGRVYVYGLNFHSYIWTPGATADDIGTWVEGPKLLDTEAEDEYSDILPNGQVMGGLVHMMFGPGTVLQLFDPTTNTNSMATPPPDSGNPYPIDYVNLPTGQVMVTAGNADWILTLTNGPQDAWRPTVSSVAYNASANTYTLSGTQISGLVNGADEGDDMTMAQNYPIVWLTDSSGNVYYCRSFNFSSMFPSKGSKVETTDFTTPAGLPSGSYNLYVSAVGVQSKNPFPFTVGQSSTTGAAGSSGSGTGGSSPGTGGAAGSAGGAPGTGGTTGGGGVKGTGGTATTGSGGTAGRAGGSGGSSTTTGAGGGLSTGGSNGTGGASITGSGGANGSGGSTTSGSGGTNGSGGSSATGSGGSTPPGGAGGSSGCSCEISNGGQPAGISILALLLGATLMRRRRRPR